MGIFELLNNENNIEYIKETKSVCQKECDSILFSWKKCFNCLPEIYYYNWMSLVY
jgi:hypothetical protein